MGEIVPIRPRSLEKRPAQSDQEVKSVFKTLPPGINCDVWLRGRRYYEHGLTGPSQRNDAVLSLSHYFFYGDPERMLSPLGYGHENERKLLMEGLLRNKHNGKSKEITANLARGLKQIDRAVNWLPSHKREKKQRRYEMGVAEVWTIANDKRKALARQNIRVAVADFEEIGLPFSSRDLKLKSCCSSTTLSKHADLWKPLQARLFAISLVAQQGVYDSTMKTEHSEE